MSRSNDIHATHGPSNGGTAWWVWVLAIIGTFVVGRFVFGLLWGLLPIALVALALYGGYRMLTSDKKSQGTLAASESTATRSHRTTVSARSGTMKDEAALRSLKQRMQSQNHADADDEERARRKQQELDEFDRRLAEMEAELKRSADESSGT